MRVATILLVSILRGFSQGGDVLVHCPPWSAFDMAFNPKGDMAAVQTGDTELSFFSAPSWQKKKCRIASTDLYSFMDASRAALVGTDNRVYIVDTHTGMPLSSFAVQGNPVGPPVRCGHYLCVPVGPTGQYTPTFTVLALNFNGHVLGKFSSIPASVSTARQLLIASRDDRWLVALGMDRAIVYRVGTWQKVAEFKSGFETGVSGDWVRLCTFNSNGKLLYLGNGAHQEIIDTGTWKLKEVLPNRGHTVVAVFPRLGREGFQVLLTDGSLRDYRSDAVELKGRSDRPGGDCVEGRLGGRMAADGLGEWRRSKDKP